MKYLILILGIILLLPLVQADTTFFDNSDDIFIMSNSSIGGVIGETTGGGGCRYEWNCTNWSECLSFEKQIRNCINIGTCSDKYKTPQVEQNCTYTAPEFEEGEELENETEKQNETEKINREKIVDIED